jgi:hypothetical protein
MLEIHKAALECSNVAYHEFLLFYKAAEKIVYGFVEGKDDPSFYRGLIESQLPNGWSVKLIKSGNKTEVLTIFSQMNWSRFPKKRVCFFIDRDLSEFLGGETHSGENLYITDGYSIENEAINFGTMERVLEEILGVTGLNPSEDSALQSLFESNLTAFREAMAPVMAQILLWRRAGKKVSLNNINLREIFFFENAKIKLKPEFNSSESRIHYAALRVGAVQANDTEIARAEVEFRGKHGLEKYIRGKYLLWFFIQCGKEIHKSIPLFCPRHKDVPKARIPLGSRNAIVLVGHLIRCPESLKEFVKHNYHEYINEVAFAA